MWSSDSDSNYIPEEENEEGKLYQWIFEMSNEKEGKKQKEADQTPAGTHEDHPPLEDRSEVQMAENKKVAQNLSEPKGLCVDISDYFNYGFDEETWISYCKKQATLRRLNNELEMGHAAHEEQEPCGAAAAASSSFLAPRQSRACHVTRGRPDNPEVFNEKTIIEKRPGKSTTKSFHHLPRPPALRRPASDSDEPSTSVKPSSSERKAAGAGVKRTVRARGRFVLEEKGVEEYYRKCSYDRGRRRSRGRGQESRMSAYSRTLQGGAL